MLLNQTAAVPTMYVFPTSPPPSLFLAPLLRIPVQQQNVQKQPLKRSKMLNIVVNNNSIHTFTFHQQSFIHIHTVHTCINTIHCIDITTQLPVCAVACFYGSLFLTTYLILQLDNTLVTLCNDSHTTPPIGIRQIPLCSS